MGVVIETDAGLVFADAAAAEEQLMRAMDGLLALYKQDFATHTVFHLAMEAIQRQVGNVRGTGSAGIQVIFRLSFK